MKKLLALALALVMVLALAACGSSSGDTASPAAEQNAAPAAAPAEAPAAAPAAPAADGATWADYQEYLIEYAGANAPDLDEFKAQVYAIGSWDELDQTVSPWDQMFTTIGLSTWDEFQAGTVKEPAVSGGMDPNAGSGDSDASGEPSGEGSGEPRTAVTVPDGVETKTVEIPYSHPIAGEITVIVTYYGDAASGITLVSVVDPDLGEDILPMQSDDIVAELIAAVAAAEK